MINKLGVSSVFVFFPRSGMVTVSPTLVTSMEGVPLMPVVSIPKVGSSNSCLYLVLKIFS